jgi:thiosulfate/3-mercaptopyruvate sulfurtransferase
MFARAGAAAGKRSVSYCEVGQQASYTYWMARYVGLDAAMYDGSWSEYSSVDGERIVKGDQPR